MRKATKQFVRLALPDLEEKAWKNLNCCTDMRRRLAGGEIVYGAPAEKYKTIHLKARRFSEDNF